MTSLLFVLPHLQGGGAERQAIDHLQVLSNSADYRSTLVLARREGVLLRSVPPDIPVLDLGGVGHPSLLVGAGRLARIIESTQPDVVISRLWFGVTLTHFARAFARRWSGVVINVEDSAPVGYSRSVMFGPVKQRLVRRAHRSADAIVAVAPHVADQLVRMGVDPRSIRVIPNGLDLDRVASLAEVREPAVPSGRYVVKVGSLKPLKGADHLVRVMGHLPADLSLVLVGDGPQRRGLQRLAESLGLRGRVRFVGFRENPYPFVKSAAVLVQSSRIPEAWPIATAESLSLGVPVVVPSGQSPLLPQASSMERVFESTVDGSMLHVVAEALRNPPSPAERAAAARAMLDYAIGPVVDRWLALTRELRHGV